LPSKSVAGALCGISQRLDRSESEPGSKLGIFLGHRWTHSARISPFTVTHFSLVELSAEYDLKL
jgi:hypothetical protein